MLKEENTKKDLDLDIISKLSLIGDRVIVLLDEAQDHTKTDSGLYIPLNTVVEKDSGRLGTELSKRKRLSAGVVLNISQFSKQKLEDQQADLKVGDRVYVSEMVLKNIPSYEFFPKRDQLVLDFVGLVCIPHTLIEAKINNDEESTN